MIIMFGSYYDYYVWRFRGRKSMLAEDGAAGLLINVVHTALQCIKLQNAFVSNYKMYLSLIAKCIFLKSQNVFI